MNTSKIYFSPLADRDVGEDFIEIALKWRQLATELDYAGPIAWKVKRGFTLRSHAPLAGPCYRNFRDLQFNDEPTKDSLAFWVPRLIPKSMGESVDTALKILAELQQKYGLSAHHLSGFGSGALNSGLIMSRFCVWERVPLQGEWAYTESFDSDGFRLALGNFGECGLNCRSSYWGDSGSPEVGCFPLGVETAV